MSTDVITYAGHTYAGDELRGVSFQKVESLPAAALEVNTLTAILSTPAALRFFSHEPYAFFTRDRLAFYTNNRAALELDQAEPVRYFRDGSQVALAFPKELKQVGVNEWQLTAMSSVGRLTQMSHRGGLYNGTLFKDIVADICGDVPYSIQSNFADIPVYGWLPSVAPSGEDGAKKGSARDNLMRLLFSEGANLTTDSNGVLRIENLSQQISASFDEGRVYLQNFADTTDAPVTAVTILEYQYMAGGETKTLFTGTTTTGQVIHFAEPMSNLVATGFSITESGANYAVLSAGTGTLTGQAYVVTTREVTREVSESDTPNEVRLTDTTLVGLTNSTDVSRRLAAFYACRRTVTFDADFEFESAGAMISVFNPVKNESVNACISRESATASEEMKARISALVGYTPWQTVPFTDKRVLLTGSGTWTVPAGVTSVTVVLIGAGSGGKRGTNGAAGTAYGASGNIPPVGNPISAPAGKGGAGGIGGAGGASGKIFRLEITVSPGQTVAFACGIKGTGGASPTAGTETVFGSYTSASGSQSETGYTDPVTGARYAIPGTNGVDGGAGGDGGNASQGSASAGGNGKNAGTKTGGSGTNGMTGGWSNMWTVSYGGHGGGGASGQNNGGNAVAQSGTSGQGDGHGGNGASSTTPLWSNTDYGCGGNGGNGGGGGGGCGGGYYLQSRYSGDPFTWSYYPTAGSAGTGGAGGDGVNGCVILYYREPA